MRRSPTTIFIPLLLLLNVAVAAPAVQVHNDENYSDNHLVNFNTEKRQVTSPLELDMVFVFQAGDTVPSAGFTMAIEDVVKNDSFFDNWTIRKTILGPPDRWEAARQTLGVLGCNGNSHLFANCTRQWMTPVIISLQLDDRFTAIQQNAESFGIYHVSCTSTSDTIDTAAEFPHLIKGAPSGSSIVTALTKVIQSFGWKTVTLICSKNRAGRADVFQSELLKRGTKIVYTALCAYTTDCYLDALNNIKKTGSKIIVVSLTGIDHLNLFEAMNQLGMLNGEYNMVGTEALFSFIWKSIIPFIKFNANATNLIRGFTGVRLATGVGTEYQTWLKRWETWKQVNNKTSLFPYQVANPPDYWLTWVYEATYLSMKAIAETIRSGGDVFNYTQLGERIRRSNYTGITGPVYFDENSSRRGNYEVVTFDPNGEMKVVGYLTDDDKLPYFAPNASIVWKDGTTNIPYDVVPPVPLYISEGAMIAFFVIAAICIIITLTIFVIVTHKRNVVVITHSGYFYLSLILIGAIGLLVSVFVFGVDMRTVSRNQMDSLCMGEVWTVGISFILMFSSLFLKSARIIWMSMNPTLKAADRLDLKIFLIIFIFLAGEILILGLWQGKDPLKVKNYLKSDSNEVYYYCESNSYGYPIAWLIYKAVLLIFGCVTGFFSRNLDKRFNESKSIAFSIYNAFVICVIIVPLSFIQKEPDVGFILKSIGVIGISMGCIMMVFVNKLLLFFIRSQSEGTTSLSSAHTK